MLIDPKLIEFASYNELPHLIVPVITDPKKVAFGLRWAISEMEKRYKLFARTGVRNIQGYNSRPVEQELIPSSSPEEKGDEEKNPLHLPYIVIVIDELADLMMVAQADVENHIARLAQLSRAVGIHMILATQRPSVNIITGTIKANFPARLSFQVAQKVDSRTILDTVGADKLLGRGDMLFLQPTSSKLVRAQGAWTNDEDINAIVNFIKKRYPPNYELAIKQHIEKTGDLESFDNDGVDEDLLQAAIQIIRETRRASVSLLQRRMKIGYNRAGRLMDKLEEQGIVGPVHGSDPREILIDLDAQIPENEPKPQQEET
jgi:S-DNA-T family DNA segregation ATPase FtsK/SpoIIIE